MQYEEQSTQSSTFQKHAPSAKPKDHEPHQDKESKKTVRVKKLTLMETKD